MATPSAELVLLWIGLSAYALSTLLVIARNTGGQRFDIVLPALAVALMSVGLSIALRWARIGHGPFLSMFEILISNLFSLGLVFAIAYWRLRVIRPAATIVLPILSLLAVWVLLVSPSDTHLPATYQTPLLWLHVAAGKMFLGLCLVAVGLGGAICLRRVRAMQAATRFWPSETQLDQLAWQMMAVALVFQSLMLVAGAWWAQGAWGRYWAWDSLETWAFVTWVALAAAVHVRTAYRPSPEIGAVMIFLVFILAFLTFFGVPFISVSPHKGAV